MNVLQFLSQVEDDVVCERTLMVNFLNVGVLISIHEPPFNNNQIHNYINTYVMKLQ